MPAPTCAMCLVASSTRWRVCGGKQGEQARTPGGGPSAGARPGTGRARGPTPPAGQEEAEPRGGRPAVRWQVLALPDRTGIHVLLLLFPVWDAHVQWREKRGAEREASVARLSHVPDEGKLVLGK